jgi:hypothetical protein
MSTDAEREHLRHLGRDGAYLEVDVRAMGPLLEAARHGEPCPAKMLVLQNGRLELSDPAHVEAFYRVLRREANAPDWAGMDEEQRGFAIFRKIFENGLRATVSFAAPEEPSQ